MAVSKRVPADSSNDVRKSADSAVVADNGAYRNRAAPRAPLIREAPPPRAAAVIDRPFRILAEDSTNNRLVVPGYLKGTPYLLDHAENGEIAVRKFAAGHHDAILMDIQMPAMDGYEAIAAIRRLEQDDRRRLTPIIRLPLPPMKKTYQGV